MNTEYQGHTVMDNMTLQQLEERCKEVELESASIKAKLAKARAEKHISGKWADPDWYRRADTRSRFLGVEHQHLTREIAARKRQAKAASNGSIERAFVGAAKAALPTEKFNLIMEVARAEVASHG